MHMWITLVLLLLMVVAFAMVAWIEQRRHHRHASPPLPPLSFLIPCYNDGATLRETVEGIYESCGGADAEVLVADDASTDDSARVLEALARMYPIRVLRNPANLGKARTLNRLADEARHAWLVFVDADTVLNAAALADLVARLRDDPRVGAVSCPYQPRNRGWLPSLQAVDYSMVSLIQGGYNALSGLALWGGCIAVRREAFEQAGRFSVNAITEDVDLAHKLNRAGWRVQQSMVPVRGWVPETLKGWMRQKMRWTAGGFQCLYLHPSVWLRNPMHVVLLGVYAYMSIQCAVALAWNTVLLKGAFDLLDLLNDMLPWRDIVPILSDTYALVVVKNLLLALGFGLMTSIYILPLIRRWRDAAKLLLAVPFSLAYFPLYAAVSLLGLGYFIRHSRRLEAPEARAW